MTRHLVIVTTGLLLSWGALQAMAQELVSVAVPEKTMAAQLQRYETPALLAPTSNNRCSNALAVVHVVVDLSGSVRSVDYLSGYPELKVPALAAVRQWLYRPYMVGGKPVVVETRASIFYLGDGKAMPMFVPDGKGGTTGGNVLPLPDGCGHGIQIKTQKEN